MAHHSSPYVYLIGDKTLITIFKVIEPLNYDLKEIIVEKIFYHLIMEGYIPDDDFISLDDNNWEYDIEGQLQQVEEFLVSMKEQEKQIKTKLKGKDKI